MACYCTTNRGAYSDCLLFHYLLTALLQSFLSVERIKQHFKGKLVGMVLDGYLSLRRYAIIIIT